MAIKSFLGLPENKPATITDRKSLLQRFASQENVTVATGITCAFLGDCRNLREFVVAADAVRILKEEGHIVNFLLFDDSLDPLGSRQLRVAVEKDERAIAQHESFCGKPIAYLPAPHEGEGSWSAHFEQKLLDRLATFGCHPNLLSVAKLYEAGVYDRYVNIVLERGADIAAFLDKTFPNYSPQALFHPICPSCGGIGKTTLTAYRSREAVIDCDACSMTSAIPAYALTGKLNWKLDCAARWHYFGVDLEPFTKAYLDPNAGSYAVARALGNAFFGQIKANPLLIGVVKLDEGVDSVALESIPEANLGRLYTERWSNDILVTRERLVLEAAKPVAGAKSFANRVKQETASLAARRSELTASELAFLDRANQYHVAVLGTDPPGGVTETRSIETASLPVLEAVARLLSDAVYGRETQSTYAEFDYLLKSTSVEGGPEAHRIIRDLLGHTKGLPVRRLLHTVPLPQLKLVSLAASKALEARQHTLELANLRQQFAGVVGKAAVRLDDQVEINHVHVLG